MSALGRILAQSDSLDIIRTAAALRAQAGGKAVITAGVDTVYALREVIEWDRAYLAYRKTLGALVNPGTQS